MTKKPLSLMILAAVIVFSVGTVTGLSLTKNRATPAPVVAITDETKPQVVGVMIDTGDDLLGFNNSSVQAGDTVWSVLENLVARTPDLAVQSEEYQDLGRLVTSIKGFKNGQDNRYWQYWVNNQYASVAADKQAVKAGDVIMWKFTGSEFKEY